jgi:hypothetical protein
MAQSHIPAKHYQQSTPINGHEDITVLENNTISVRKEENAKQPK